MRHLVLTWVLATTAGCTILADPNEVIRTPDAGGDPNSAATEDMRTDVEVQPDLVDSAPDLPPQEHVVHDVGAEMGEHVGTEWNDGLRLQDGTVEGEYRSAVFDLGEEAALTAIRWEPDLPYGLSLAPENAQVEQVYDGTSIKRDSLSVLVPMEGSGDVLTGNPVLETSGSDVPISAQIESGSSYVEGVFGTAIELADVDYLQFPSTHPAVQFGAGDLTFSVFARTDTCEGDNNVFIGGEDRRTIQGTHMWLGCGTSNSCPNGTGVSGSFITNDDSGAGICTSGRFDDGEWHHVAVTITGHESATIRYWLDGQQVGLTTHEYAPEGRFDFIGDNPFIIGSFPTGTYYAAAALDEVALFKRALSADELAALAARGLDGVRFQVRACVDADCSTDPPFVGASGAESDWIEDPLTGDQPRVAITSSQRTRWAQYRVVLDGTATHSPSVSRVTLEFTP